MRLGRRDTLPAYLAERIQIAEKGVHPQFIMELFGHSSISLMMNTYGHVLEGMKGEAARQMDAILPLHHP